jgi:hypothetical protein
VIYHVFVWKIYVDMNIKTWKFNRVKKKQNVYKIELYEKKLGKGSNLLIN